MRVPVQSTTSWPLCVVVAATDSPIDADPSEEIAPDDDDLLPVRRHGAASRVSTLVATSHVFPGDSVAGVAVHGNVCVLVLQASVSNTAGEKEEREWVQPVLRAPAERALTAIRERPRECVGARLSGEEKNHATLAALSKRPRHALANGTVTGVHASHLNSNDDRKVRTAVDLRNGVAVRVCIDPHRRECRAVVVAAHIEGEVRCKAGDAKDRHGSDVTSVKRVRQR